MRYWIFDSIVSFMLYFTRHMVLKRALLVILSGYFLCSDTFWKRACLSRSRYDLRILVYRFCFGRLFSFSMLGVLTEESLFLFVVFFF